MIASQFNQMKYIYKNLDLKCAYLLLAVLNFSSLNQKTVITIQHNYNQLHNITL